MAALAHLAPTVLIRAARGSDGPALRRLAELDSRELPAGELLVAETDDELVAAVRAAAAGGTYLNPRLGAQLAAAPAQEQAPDDLSAREVDVLGLIALGHTNVEIGQKLFLSVRTVETHRAHIQQKLRRSTRAELVRYAIDRGLLDQD